VTSEPWLPVEFDPTEYENQPGAPGAAPSTPTVPVDDVAPSAPSPVPRITSPREGALTFFCRACLLDWSEPYCDVCGANLTLKYDRPVRHTDQRAPHGPDRSES
jgi:hypothetical protein